MIRGRALTVGAALAATVVVAVGAWIDPRRALTAYLFAYTALFTLVVGAMCQVMIARLTGGHWFDTYQPLAFGIADAMPIVALLALPVLLGARWIYPWANPSALEAPARAIVERKEAWLNVPFFLARAVIYLVTWVAVARRLRDAPAAGRIRSALGLIVVGLTLTFAAFDWLMSLDPTWYSTIYGVYLFAGGILSANALLAVLHWRRGGTAGEGGDSAPLGKLLLTLGIFWAYIAFSQYLIIWIADIPIEAEWYAARGAGAWGVIALVVGVAQFVVPLAVLASYGPKRRPPVLAAVGATILGAHLLDVYWLVMPSVGSASWYMSWIDVGCVVFVTIVIASTYPQALGIRPSSTGG